VLAGGAGLTLGRPDLGQAGIVRPTSKDASHAVNVARVASGSDTRAVEVAPEP